MNAYHVKGHWSVGDGAPRNEEVIVATKKGEAAGEAEYVRGRALQWLVGMAIQANPGEPISEVRVGLDSVTPLGEVIPA